MKDEYYATLPPAALSQGACRGPDVDPEWWVGDHSGKHHRDCQHQEARHICIVHCPVVAICEKVAAQNPEAWTGMVIAGQLRVTVGSYRETKPTVSPARLRCLLCEPLDD